jgi:ethanolamine utilization protein EutQ
LKTLISVKDVDAFQASGKGCYCIDNDTIITPAAQDRAAELGICFECQDSGCQASIKQQSDSTGDDALLALLKKLLSGGLGVQASLPYESCSHANGLKVVKGKSVKMDVFDTGNPTANVTYQELISKDESHISAGFLEIDHSSFDWELTYEEIDYVIEGTLQVTIDGVTYTAEAGDVLFVPSHSKVTWGSPNKARIFYATYPANWADLD